MKSALLLSEAPNVYGKVRTIMLDWGAVTDNPGEVVQYADGDGRLLTVFEDPGEDWEEELIESITPAEAGVVPNLPLVSACYIECRWEDLFAAKMRLIAESLSETTWIFDSNGTIWRADRVDPTRIQL